MSWPSVSVVSPCYPLLRARGARESPSPSRLMPVGKDVNIHDSLASGQGRQGCRRRARNGAKWRPAAWLDEPEVHKINIVEAGPPRSGLDANRASPSQIWHNRMW